MYFTLMLNVLYAEFIMDNWSSLHDNIWKRKVGDFVLTVYYNNAAENWKISFADKVGPKSYEELKEAIVAADKFALNMLISAINDLKGQDE